jgi:hypothetical protein
MEAADMADEETKRDYPYLRLARTRFLNFVFKGARPLGISWKDFYERRACQNVFNANATIAANTIDRSKGQRLPDPNGGRPP